jgi:hypothetical protein
MDRGRWFAFKSLGYVGLHGRISPLLEGGLQHLSLVTTTSVQESIDVKPIGYALTLPMEIHRCEIYALWSRVTAIEPF